MEPRQYSSALRSNQARATRRAVVAAAAELFVDRGYSATTIDAVAERAGVGRKTVFAAVGGKGALLKLAWDWALTGDDEPVAMAERPAVQAMLAERDPHRLVRMWVGMMLDVGQRAAPVGAVVLAAADVDADAQVLRDLIRRESLTGATAFVTHLESIGGLRSDVGVERAADSCWALVNSLLMPLLVGSRGWSMQDYGDWLMRVASATLLEPSNAAIPRTAGVRTVHEPQRERYVASADGAVAGRLSYQRSERLLLLTATEVGEDFENLPVADSLARTALDDVRSEGSRKVVALCPYVSWWIGQHPDYACLVYQPGD